MCDLLQIANFAAKAGNFLRTIEEEWGTLMLLSQCVIGQALTGTMALTLKTFAVGRFFVEVESSRSRNKAGENFVAAHGFFAAASANLVSVLHGSG